LVQTGAAVLGSAGDTWNFFNASFYSTGFALGSALPLNAVDGSASGITFHIYNQFGNADYGQYNPQGSATDPGTTALMTSSMESYHLNGGDNYILEWTGLSAYAGQTFSLVLFAGAPAPITQSFNFNDYGNGVAVTGGNTASTLSTSSTDRTLSGGAGDAYVVYTGTFNGGNTIDIDFSAPSTPQRGANFNGFQLQIVPEPGTLALAAMGGFGMLVLYRRRAA
jgi:hypothetical protein